MIMEGRVATPEKNTSPVEKKIPSFRRFYVKVFGDTFETDFDPVADYYRSSGGIQLRWLKPIIAYNPYHFMYGITS